MASLGWSAWLELLGGAFAAGWVDAAMGGGGLIQVPLLFALIPGAAPAALLGTNKVASLVGTLGAAWRYARSHPPAPALILSVALPAALAAAVAARAVVGLPAQGLRAALPVLLAVVWLQAALGSAGLEHRPRQRGRAQGLAAAVGGALVGAYDGAWGPGAGAFYKAWFTRVLGFDFLSAAAPAKLANAASNLGALAAFALAGVVLWPIALPMAVANFAGGQLGARTALRKGNAWLRRLFLLLVAVLILRAVRDLLPQGWLL